MYTAVLIVGISQMTFSNSNELIMLDDFDPSPKVEWNFVADSVMAVSYTHLTLPTKRIV